MVPPGCRCPGRRCPGGVDRRKRDRCLRPRSRPSLRGDRAGVARAQEQLKSHRPSSGRDPHAGRSRLTPSSGAETWSSRACPSHTHFQKGMRRAPDRVVSPAPDGHAHVVEPHTQEQERVIARSVGVERHPPVPGVGVTRPMRGDLCQSLSVDGPRLTDRERSDPSAFAWRDVPGSPPSRRTGYCSA